MTLTPGPRQPAGYSWQSSKLFIECFVDYFVFSFILPILPDILEGRLRANPSHTQIFTSIILSMNAIVSIAIAPLVGHLSDRTRRKNTLMQSAYLIHVVGTAVTAWATTAAGLIIGRLIQTIASSFLWIAGMAILGGTVEPNQLARVMAICMLFLTAGLLSGPVVAAALFNSVSYSLTWLSAFVVLIVGMTLQSLVLEPYNLPSKIEQNNPETGEHDHTPDIPRETDSLLPPVRETYRSRAGNPEEEQSCHSAPASSALLYKLMLQKRRVTTALTAETLLAILISSFEATIPLHIKQAFHWQSLQAGILFLLLQVPTIILIFPAGWLKDTYGMRLPVSAGFLLMAPSVWLLGAPGTKQFDEWVDVKTGQVIFTVALVMIGVCRTLVMGFGAVEVLRGAAELASEHPGIFGASTGHSRAFVLSNVTWKLGMFAGPLLSGFLTEEIGYYFMNLILAIASLFMGVLTYVALREHRFVYGFGAF
ncbi:major facilitator superfamily domain-containing protein [Aspergillus keveii]|uniref:Major facilitator superfamily domain-containing protein n=1 Tax=Aspergillus keveii TaxID=714993 RepID=A0ABR4GC35_9EURO